MTLKLNGSTSGYTAIDAPATAGSNTLVLPPNNGSANQILQTDGSGNLTWVDKPSSGLSHYFSLELGTTISASGETDVVFDTINTSSDNSAISSGVYTVQSGGNGVWALSGAVTLEDGSGYAHARAWIKRTPSGGSSTEIFRCDSRYRSSSSGVFTENTLLLHWMGTLGVGDTLKVTGQVYSNSGSPTIQASDGSTHFSGFKIA